MHVRAVKVSLTAADKRANGDLDQLIDGEDGVLHECPVGPGDMSLGEGAGRPQGPLPRPDHGQRAACGEVVAGPVLQPDHRVGAHGDADQLRVTDVLDVATDL